MTTGITSADYERVRVSPVWPASWNHAAVVKQLVDFKQLYPQTLELEEIGKSVEQRTIFETRLGSGKTRVLMWSQMHGDEPTHTAVLMDLLNFLLTEPAHPIASDVLSKCRLHLIVMLNPDGAERNARRNAQDIDINRDARDLQTPEGRILADAVKRVQPQFGFNLHDHNRRATAGIQPLPAAVALLAPPIDQDNTQTDHVRRAKQLVMTFAESVKEECPGMIARYNADYMSRAFGEAVQKSGAVTMLVEAGGWSELDETPLARVHFLGTTRTLHAVATDDFLKADPAEYDKLPVSGGRELFDLMIEKAEVVNGLGQKGFHADIGINLVDYRGADKGCKGATIADLGDLKVMAGKTKIDGNRGDLHCFPGALAYLPGITPTHLPTEADIADLLSCGVTTLLGSVELANDEDVIEFTKLEGGKLPINLGFVGDATGFNEDNRNAHLDRLLRAMGHGLLAVVEEILPKQFVSYCQCFRVPLIPRKSLSSLTDYRRPRSIFDESKDSHAVFKHLGLRDRGVIRRGAVADLAMFRVAGGTGTLLPKASYTLVGGNKIVDDSELRLLPIGQILRRR